MKLMVVKLKPIYIFGGLLILSLLFFNSSLRIGFLSDDWHWLWLAKNIPFDWNIFLTNYEGANIGGSYNPLLFLLFKIFN